MSTDTIKQFTRKLSDELIEKLQAEPLFCKFLLPDIVGQEGRAEVFSAVRNEEIHFYHRGARLFSYGTDGFTTHWKYVPAFYPGHNYVKESELPLKPIRNFVDGYIDIKDLCEHYGRDEPQGVAELCVRFSYAAATNPDHIVVLDKEAAFSVSSRGGKKTHERIDLVLYSPRETRLLLVEAKRIDNPDLNGEVPKVVGQIGRYREQVANQRLEILQAYTDCIRAVNKLFGLKLSDPTKVTDDIPLFIFGYNGVQKKERLNEVIKPALKKNNVMCIEYGDIKDVPQSTLAKWFGKFP